MEKLLLVGVALSVGLGGLSGGETPQGPLVSPISTSQTKQAKQAAERARAALLEDLQSEIDLYGATSTAKD